MVSSKAISDEHQPKPYQSRHSQLRSRLVNTRNQQRHAKRPTHHRLLVMHALPEPERQITHGLCDALDLDLFVVREGVVLCGDACVVDHGACVGGEAGHGTSEVTVDFHDFFDGAGFEEGGLDAFLDGEDDALGGADADGGRAELRGGMLVLGEDGRDRGAHFDSLDGIFDWIFGLERGWVGRGVLTLEESTFWREGVYTTIWEGIRNETIEEGVGCSYRTLSASRT